MNATNHAHPPRKSSVQFSSVTALICVATPPAELDTRILPNPLTQGSTATYSIQRINHLANMATKLSPDSGQIATTAPLPTTSSPPPAHVVLATNELFEQILLGLDIKTLLLSQRVDGHWRAMISKSTLLQKKLYFLPATKDDMPKLNTLEVVLGRGLDVNAIKVGQDPADEENGELLVLNSLLLKLTVVAYAGATYTREGVLRGATTSSSVRIAPQYYPSIEGMLETESQPTHLGVPPSWERMLLVQPQPTFAVRCLLTLSAGICYQRYKIDIRASLQELLKLAVGIFKHKARLIKGDMAYGPNEERDVELSIFEFPVTEEDLEKLSLAQPKKREE